MKEKFFKFLVSDRYEKVIEIRMALTFNIYIPKNSLLWMKNKEKLISYFRSFEFYDIFSRRSKKISRLVFPGLVYYYNSGLDFIFMVLEKTGTKSGNIYICGEFYNTTVDNMTCTGLLIMGLKNEGEIH